MCTNELFTPIKFFSMVHESKLLFLHYLFFLSLAFVLSNLNISEVIPVH